MLQSSAIILHARSLPFIRNLCFQFKVFFLFGLQSNIIIFAIKRQLYDIAMYICIPKLFIFLSLMVIALSVCLQNSTLATFI